MGTRVTRPFGFAVLRFGWAGPLGIIALYRVNVAPRLLIAMSGCPVFLPLRFSEGLPIFSHADLRVSLRKMRKGQRDSRSFERLERNSMSALRVHFADEEIFSVCFERQRELPRRQQARGRRWRWMRPLLRRRAPPPLTSSKPELRS